MILAVEEQIIETARSINLVIHTKDKLEHLQGRIDSYMGDEVVERRILSGAGVTVFEDIAA